MRRMLLVVVPAFAMLGCGGAKEDAAAGGAPEQGEPAAGAPAAEGGASIGGTVKFTGTPPANPTIDMSEEAACRAKHSGQPTDPEFVVSNGNLANVFVYVKSGLAGGKTYTAPSDPVVLDQEGCLYKPRVFGVMVGQRIEIKNSDPVLHNIKAVPKENRGFNISQPTEGMTTTRTFTTREVMVPLECNVHSWMNAFAGVLDHPYYATSAPDGSFKISGLPAGTYEVEAWHEKLGAQTMQVTVAADESKTQDITFAAK